MCRSCNGHVVDSYRYCSFIVSIDEDAAILVFLGGSVDQVEDLEVAEDDRNVADEGWMIPGSEALFLWCSRAAKGCLVSTWTVLLATGLIGSSGGGAILSEVRYASSTVATCVVASELITKQNICTLTL